MLGANLAALAAANTLAVINLCAKVLHFNRTRFTGFDASHAANATNRTGFARHGALVMILAMHKRPRIRWNGFYQVLRARLHTFSAASA